MKRRRFLTVAAGFAAFPAFAGAPLRWEGIALGARASLELSAPDAIARRALSAALAEIEAVEAAFSLFRSDSALSELNRSGRLDDAPLFDPLLDIVDRVHEMTGGLFDPTVQPLWQAQLLGRPATVGPIGWHHVRRPGPGAIRLPLGRALTFNGIAQGFATDRVVSVLRAHGLTDTFVNLGEQAVLGRPRRLGLVDPQHGRVGAVTLSDGALATSSPTATPLGATGHILNPTAPASRPKWSTVTVEAETAALADGLSTALVHGSLILARDICKADDVRRVILVDTDGNVRSLT